MFEFFQEHKILVGVIVITVLYWLYSIYKNLATNNIEISGFDQEYNKVLSSSKYKVKGKFEE
jgi:hypothetical protein